MGIFSWDGESEDVARDSADSAIPQLGPDALSASPTPSASPALPATSSVPVAANAATPDSQPMTRRELRELERAAEQRAAEFRTSEEALSTVAVTPPAPTALPALPAPTVPPATFLAPPATAATPALAAPAAVSEAEQIFAPSGPDAIVEPSAARSKKAPTFARASRSRRSRRIPTPAIVQSGPAANSPRPAARQAGRHSPLKRRILTRLMSTGAMAGAALMLVATSLPANAFLSAEAAPLSVSTQADTVKAPVVAEAQSMKAAATAAAPVLSRDGYTAVSLREQIFLKYGNRNFSYVANATGAIRWPFPIAVPISDGYGYRAAPCAGCSTEHHGVDFTPGAGTAIGVIADGVVVGVNDEDWSYGQHVVVEHVINGQKIQSWYAHMQTGSIRVKVGDVVTVGQEIGQVGSTGQSTGAHLHLEIHVNGVPVDPFAWLKANAG